MARPKKVEEVVIEELPVESTPSFQTPEAIPLNDAITSTNEPRPQDQAGKEIKYFKDSSGCIYTQNPGLIAKNEEHKARNNGMPLFTPCSAPAKAKK